MYKNHPCPSCGSVGMSVFYELEGVPAHSVLLLPRRKAALDYPCGDIALGFCPTCGFISNVAFDSALHEYSSAYEATQAFSPTFNAFAYRLARRLVERYDLHGKTIIEIGCGQGEFLTLLCELGGNRGIGFDPAYDSRRSPGPTQQSVTFVKDFYSEAYADYCADFVCCKMTLEHIQHTADFVSTVQRSLRDQPDAVVFFQVPDVTRILQELAFWDIYYEHCSYFSLGSLARLFRKCGFEVVSLAKEYDGQYLMIEARPGNGKGRDNNRPAGRGDPFDLAQGRPCRHALEQEDDLETLVRDVTHFSENCARQLDSWRHDLRRLKQAGQRAVIWGAGSKGVAFLTTLGIRDEIEVAVDINPHKHGTYMAGTGQQIVAPGFLREYRPDVVIVMNPVYCNEIQQVLDRMGCAAELRPV